MSNKISIIIFVMIIICYGAFFSCSDDSVVFVSGQINLHVELSLGMIQQYDIFKIDVYLHRDNEELVQQQTVHVDTETGATGEARFDDIDLAMAIVGVAPADERLLELDDVHLLGGHR